MRNDACRPTERAAEETQSVHQPQGRQGAGPKTPLSRWCGPTRWSIRGLKAADVATLEIDNDPFPWVRTRHTCARRVGVGRPHPSVGRHAGRYARIPRTHPVECVLAACYGRRIRSRRPAAVSQIPQAKAGTVCRPVEASKNSTGGERRLTRGEEVLRSAVRVVMEPALRLIQGLASPVGRLRRPPA